MIIKRLCEMCMVPATDSHHKLSQSKVYRKIYDKLLDEPFNIIYLCSTCHLNRVIPKYTEKEFRYIAANFGYKLPEPSKTLRLKGQG